MRKKITGLGEVLWDVFGDTRVFGGAPANFAWHAQRLGAEGWVVSAIGTDPDGEEIARRIDALGLASCLQRDSVHPTGRAEVLMQPDGSHQFVIQEESAWDYLQMTPDVAGIVRSSDMLCFGSLAQRGALSAQTIRECLSAVSPDTLRLFDVNLRQHYYCREVLEESLRLAELVKLNDEELLILADMLGLGEGETTQLTALLTRFNLQLIVLTKGAEGSRLLSSDGADSSVVAPAIKAVDTVGAGDSFTASVAVGYLAGMDIGTINRMASTVAAYVCTCRGATPLYTLQELADFAISCRMPGIAGIQALMSNPDKSSHGRNAG